MPSDLSKNILATLAYYDVMDYPMTAFELWKQLFRVNKSDSEKKEQNKTAPTLLEVFDELKREKIGSLTEEYRGFYFLKGRKSLVEQRIKRNKISEKKIQDTDEGIQCFALRSLCADGGGHWENGHEKRRREERSGSFASAGKRQDFYRKNFGYAGRAFDGQAKISGENR